MNSQPKLDLMHQNGWKISMLCLTVIGFIMFMIALEMTPSDACDQEFGGDFEKAFGLPLEAGYLCAAVKVIHLISSYQDSLLGEGTLQLGSCEDIGCLQSSSIVQCTDHRILYCQNLPSDRKEHVSVHIGGPESEEDLYSFTSPGR